MIIAQHLLMWAVVCAPDDPDGTALVLLVNNWARICKARAEAATSEKDARA